MALEYKAIIKFCIHCYAFLSDESLSTWLSLTSLYIGYYSSLTYERLVFR